MNRVLPHNRIMNNTVIHIENNGTHHGHTFFAIEVNSVPFGVAILFGGAYTLYNNADVKIGGGFHDLNDVAAFILGK